MGRWIRSLSRARLFEVALAIALGYAIATLADEFASVGMHVLAQHFGKDLTGDGDTVLGLLNLFSTGPYTLNFTIADTLVVYGEVVSATLALLFVVLACVVVIRMQARRFASCQFCAARVPRGAARCAICGSGLASVHS